MYVMNTSRGFARGSPRREARACMGSRRTLMGARDNVLGC